jgi:hypothetical protein
MGISGGLWGKGEMGFGSRVWAAFWMRDFCFGYPHRMWKNPSYVYFSGLDRAQV